MANLSEKAKEERARYMREWRKKNKAKAKKYAKNYWERRAKERENAEKKASEK